MKPAGSTLRHTQSDEAASTRDLWLEIRRGRTRSPRRPVRSRRFLIGAGSNCQLQLGGEEIPILHSILLINEEGAHIDAVVPAPELTVNGVPCRAADLQHGDVFSIGRFEFSVHVPDQFSATQAATAEELPLDDAADLESMSAAELIDRIEREQACIDRFEAARQQGAKALLQSIARRAREISEQESARVLRIPEPAAAERPAVEEVPHRRAS